MTLVMEIKKGQHIQHHKWPHCNLSEETHHLMNTLRTTCKQCTARPLGIAMIFPITLQVVSLHCNLSEETHHLMNEDRLNMMKKDATLINCARGPVIDEVALTNFLQANENFRRGAAPYIWLHSQPFTQISGLPHIRLAAEQCVTMLCTH